jgi:aminomuconate-semialdehyde/2-hydroxymuconate-6-semialdehyde dehydrogenase
LDENLDELALAETTDNGKPLWLSKRVDIPRASANFRFFATGIMHFASESHVMEDKASIILCDNQLVWLVVFHRGIYRCIYLPGRLPPALAAGNCVVAKPSEVSPVTAYLLAKICKDAGLPDGVLNILQGTGNVTGEAIINHPGIKAISFYRQHAPPVQELHQWLRPQFKKLSLELGGKNPSLIFADCNWEKMMKTNIQSSFSNQGQICLCGSRLLVQDSVYEKFKQEFVKRARELIVGDPLEPNTKQGAVVSKMHFEKVMRCIETAKAEGGKILCGGNAVKLEGRCANGFFIEPTVIEGLGPDCQTNMEEIFGPVVTLQKFKTEEEALQLANACDYGLAGTIWTQDISRANRVAAKLEAGIIWVNCWLLRDLRTPFGGFKNSGVGREGGWEALRFFTDAKNVCVEI